MKNFFLQCARVWKITRKPSGREIKNISKISAIGVLAIGFLGFVIALFMRFFFR